MVEVAPIIDEAAYNKAQRLKNRNKRIRESARKRTYFLGGMIRCGNCGTGVFGLTVSKRKKGHYSYYRCAANHQPDRYASKCESKMRRANVVDKPVWDWLKSILLNPETLDHSLDEYQEQSDAAQNPILRMIESSRNKLAKLESQHKRLIDAYTEGVLSLDDLAKNKTDLDKQIADAQKAIESLQVDLEPQTLTEDDIKTIHQFAQEFRGNVELMDADLAARRELAKLLQFEVTMYKEWLSVSCVLGQQRLTTNNITGYNELP